MKMQSGEAEGGDRQDFPDYLFHLLVKDAELVLGKTGRNSGKGMCTDIRIHPERERDGEVWNICGSLCTINDILVKQLPAAGLQPGDVLAFKKAGAYCVTEGIAMFLSRDLPAVVLLNETGDVLVREHTEVCGLNTPHYQKGE